MVDLVKKVEGMIDFSIMPWLLCNLNCPFCMYDSNSYQGLLDLYELEKFLYTFNWDKINAVGFYGGEVSLYPSIWEIYVTRIPKEIQKFCITNGTWSTNLKLSYEFISVVERNDIKTFISTTPYHTERQDKLFLDTLIASTPLFEYKEDDTKSTLLPMGRNYNDGWSCTRKCLSDKWKTAPLRYAVMPNGDVIFQSCDGIYPKVGTYKEPLDYLINKIEICERKKAG